MIRFGERLREERKKRGMSVEEVALQTKIRPEFIKALESSNYSKLPSSTYATGFAKNYIVFLGLSQRELLPVFRREFDEKEFLGVLPDSFTKGEVRVRPRLLSQTVFAGVVIGIAILGFILFQYRFVFFPPQLSLSYPPENAILSAQTVTISGKTDSNASVTVNNQPVYVGSNGSFRKDIDVFPGDITITVKAISQFGKTSTQTRYLHIKP